MQSQLKTAIYWLLFFAFLLYWTSPDGRDKEYTKSLEKIVAKCLDGGAITIDNQIHFCSTYNIGERI